MKAKAEDGMVKEVNSIEEYSIYSLERSLEGLNYLEADAKACCDNIQNNKLSPAFRQLKTLASNLHSFFVFESDVSSLFAPDGTTIADVNGALQETESSFKSALEKLGSMIAEENIKSIPELINHSLLPVLGRFRSLIPLLKSHIETEYANA